MPENLPPNSAAPIPLAFPFPIPGVEEAVVFLGASETALNGTVPLLE